jgi:hypothetical protein
MGEAPGEKEHIGGAGNPDAVSSTAGGEISPDPISE